MSEGWIKELPDFIDRSLFNDFLENRNEIKKRCNTDLSIKRIIIKLTRFHEKGHDIDQILEESIANGWRGVFEPKGFSHGNSKKVSTVEEFYQQSEDWIRANL